MASYFLRFNRSLEQLARKDAVIYLLILFSSFFVLMNRVTVLLFFSASILTNTFQREGDIIHCELRMNRAMSKRMMEMVNSFCWLQSTYVIPRASNKDVESIVPHPGYDKNEMDKPTIHQAYYQWVVYALFLQGMLFFMPQYLWKCWENGMVKSLTDKLKLPLLKPEENEESCELLAHSLRIHWGHFSGYFWKYLLFQLLQFVNITCQLWLLDAFLGGVFSNFNAVTMRWFEIDFSSPIEAFPRMMKCEFPYFGLGRGFEVMDATCVLPLNVFLEKLFFFLWFWIFALWFLSAFNFLHHLLLCALPVLRFHVLRKESLIVNTVILETLVRHSKVSDWLVLYFLSRNISCKYYGSVINQLTQELEDGRRTPFRNEETTVV